MVITSPHPDVAIPDLPFHEFVLHRASQLGDKPALIDGPSGRTITYAQLARSVRSMAAGLAARGFGKGDVLAIYSPNLPEYAVVFLAVASLGGVNTTVNPLYTVDELEKQLLDSQASMLVTVPPFLENARLAAARAGIREVFVIGDGDGEGATPLSELLSCRDAPPVVEIEPRKDLLVLPYSSGTTGLPKGVMLTHRNLVANIAQLTDIEPYGEIDTLIGILPFFHIYGLTVLMGVTLHKGATIVTMPRFELEAFLQTMQDYKITWAYLVPPIVLALAKHPLVDSFDLSKLQSVLSGAAPLGKEVSDACSERLGCLVRQGYGLTETSPCTHLVPYDPERVRAGSVGWLVPGTEARVVDETGRDRAANERGELWLRGPQVMPGYLNRPEATAEVLDADGWFHSGDIGYVDEEGYFFIVDRLKELIKYKGMQVAPAELEALLLSHPAVADAAVIGSADEEAGELPKAFVVQRSEISAEDLMAFVADKIAPHKKVRLVEFIDEIPKSPSGKILRRVLRARDSR